MKDLRMNDDGDLYINEVGDIEVTDDVLQAIKIRLKWFLGEWRLNTEYGMPYFDEVFVKNPSTSLLEDRLRSEILDVEGVQSVDSIKINIDKSTRVSEIQFSVVAGNESLQGEVTVYA